MTEGAMPPYQFTTAHPPLFSKKHHVGDVWAISPELLETTVGTGSWMTTEERHDRGGASERRRRWRNIATRRRVGGCGLWSHP